MIIADWMKGIAPEQLQEPYRGIACHIGVENTIWLASLYQGTPIYFPKFDSSVSEIRNRKIKEEFNGSNHKELARKYDLTERWIYAILNNEVSENQLSLF